MLSVELIDSLFPAGLPAPSHWEERYPPRSLPAGAEVTRFAPSPTGWLHIGAIFTAGVNRDIASHSGGRYLLRIEDTDQARFEEGALEQFEAGFAYFGIQADESDPAFGAGGAYGPYTQSARAEIYLTYVRELMRAGKAYPCFATREELTAIAERQKAVGALPGYYGDWAIWRDAPQEQVQARLDAGDPYVVRFRSPGIGGHRVSYTDAIRGELSFDDNRNDVVILKSSDQALRLPTYHLAHVVDDHLMRVTLVIRSEEWLSSVPLHHQLFDALGFPRIRYAHVAPLMKQDGTSRRKLSKRRDPEASVNYYIDAGLPGRGGAVLPARPRQRAAGGAAAAGGGGRAAPAGRVRRGRAAARHGQAGRRERRLRGHPVRRGDPRAGAAVGRRVRQGPGGGAAGGPGTGAAGAADRAGGHRQPAQGPTQVVGVPPGVRVLLRVDLRARDRPGRRAVRRPAAGVGPRAGGAIRGRLRRRRGRTWRGSSRSARWPGRSGSR